MSFFQGLMEGQKKFGEDISSIVNSLLLSIVYLFGVGGTFIFAKIFGKSFLGGKIELNKNTYWNDLNLTKKPIEEYYRQF